ncbi:MAG: hypothetical protein QOJ45_266 [Verrucomicrobiota bacterium]|jgi:hypothetical protein
MKRNDFALGLLNYSAERDDSIGRPERWGSPPPLLISSTPLHDEMSALADEVWGGAPHLVWYFLIGGPGNGKSEAVGAFVRRLNSNAKQASLPLVFDSSKGHDGGTVSYWFQEKIPHGEIALLQDISIPKKIGSDPAEDVLASLSLCAESGAHLVACANRGMLLRATRLARAMPPYEWLLPILENIDKQSQETSIAANAHWKVGHDGREIEIRVWPLDHESILHSGGNGNPWAETDGSLFDQVIATAVAQERWEDAACDKCLAREFCPMIADAHWLRDPDRRRSFLRILRHAEVWSGQRIVLREALGLVSTVLVGTPSDFVENGKELHPCDWVEKRVSGTPVKPKNEQSLIELVSHRVYQDLFGRAAPTGLVLDRQHHRRDEWICEKLQTLNGIGKTVALALRTVDRDFAKQAGPLRLLGADGILHHFDPSVDNAWCSKHSLSTDGQVLDLRQLGAEHQTGLERELGDLFARLEDATRIIPPHKDPAKVFAAVYRWASTIFVRLAGTALGETPDAESLTDYLSLLLQPLRPLPATSGQTTLRDLMQSVAGSENRIELVPSFVASVGSLQLKPAGARGRSNDPRWPANDRLTLQVSTSPTDSSSVLLTATTFIDAWRKHIKRVAAWNISPAIDKLMQAWREDFTVKRGQFRNLESVEFLGNPPLEFEFISATEVQVRTK